MSLKLSANSDDPYLGTILQMMELEFPGAVNGDKKVMFEAVVSELIGTKQQRYGPMPDPEGLVEIRAVVRKAMDAGAPIPILIPWGASKQGEGSVDIADVMALKQLECLERRVCAHYKPGVDIRIRLENLTDESMFGDDWIPKTDLYVRDFQKLHKTLMFGGGSAIWREDFLMNSSDFRRAVATYSPIILEAMNRSSAVRGDWIRGHIPEWHGNLDDEILDFYLNAYDRFYPKETTTEKMIRLSKYFGGAITRFILGGTGADKTWGKDYLTLSFTGIPWGKNGKRIFYRTIPSRYTNQHRAPWIGKGYVRIKGREATPAIAGWNGDGLPFNPMFITFNWGGDSVEVAADYVVVE
jgi:hypothetical protein